MQIIQWMIFHNMPSAPKETTSDNRVHATYEMIVNLFSNDSPKTHYPLDDFGMDALFLMEAKAD